MPRQTRKQATIRAGAGDANITKPSVPVASYPPYVSYGSPRVDRSAGATELKLGEALRGFGTTVQKVAVRQHETNMTRRRLRGQADALKQGAPEDWAAIKREVLMDPEKGQVYWNAYSKQAAALAATQQSHTLADELNDRTDIASEAEFNTWFADRTQGDIDLFGKMTEEDPETSIAYLARLEETEMKLRGVVQKRQADREYTEAETNFNLVAQSDLELVLGKAGGYTPEDMKTYLEATRRSGQDLLLEPADINEAQIRAIGEEAVRSGDPSLLNIFEYPHEDGTPGLAFTTKGGKDISDYRAKATKERDARRATALKAEEFETVSRIEDAIREGNTHKALGLIDDYVEADPETRGKSGVSLRNKALKVDEKEARIAANVNRVLAGDTLSIAPEHRKETMAAYADRQMETAVGTGDPEAIYSAVKDIASVGGQMGQMAPAHAAKLNDLNMVDAEAMSEQMELYDIYRGVSPSLLNDMPTATRDMYDMANRMVEGGIPQDQIMVRMQELQSPEGQARLNAMKKDKELQEEIRSEALDVEARKGFFDDIEVEDLVTSEADTNWILNRAMEYKARTGRPTDEALSVAAEQWQTGFGVVELPDGTYSSYYKGNGMPANLEEMVQWGSDGITEELKDPNEPDNYWMLQPDPATRKHMDPQFLIRDKHGRMQTELRDGLVVPMTVGLSELRRGFNDHMTSETEEEQAENQRRREAGYTDPYRDLADDYMPPYEDGESIPKPAPDDFMPPMYDDLNPEPMPGDMPPSPPGPYGGAKTMPPVINKAMDMVMKFEGFRAEPYYATEDEKRRGIQTIGYGRTSNVIAGSKVSEAEEKKWLASQLQDTEEALESNVGPQWAKLTSNQKAAVISLAYNVDKDVVGQLKRSKALAALKRGDFETFKREAFDENLGFTKQSGKKLGGLVKRRNEELAIFDTLETASK